ncbi:MAG: thermonuclease family protein [Xanthomonadales bacterium]|jgi:endonuclease YncB( thermonuclease family)|nr:thermonuclease family protein [Xanthomonadales bacterium]
MPKLLRTLIVLAAILLLTACGDADANADNRLRDELIARSIAGYSGQCACPYSTRRNGAACGDQSSYAQGNRRGLYCFRKDIPDRVLAQHRGKPLPTVTPALKPGAVLRGRATVSDGDTLKLGKQSIRLGGVDAFELSQTCTRNGRRWDCGREARDWLREAVGSREVACTLSERDRYQRWVAHCAVGRDSLNAGIVEAGLALAYVQHSKAYQNVERRAQGRKVGAWARGVDFEKPWDWRAARR